MPSSLNLLNSSKDSIFVILQIAISMAAKANSLARELKSIKSDLSFIQERCGLLEEENKRLRDGFVKGVRPEEDDLVCTKSPKLFCFWSVMLCFFLCF